MKINKIIITGGAGFIGSHIAEHCFKNFKNAKIIIIDKFTYAGFITNLKNISNSNRVKIIKSDICTLKNSKSIFENTDLLIHAAAESHVDNSFGNSKIFSKSNIIGTHNILELSKYYSVKKIIHISTDEVYGDILKGSFTETHVLNPTNPYSASKAAAEMIINSYIKSFNLPVIIIRPNNIYGTRQFPEKLIPKSIHLLKNNKKVPLHGNGKNVRHFLSIKDFIAALFLIINKGKLHEIYNVGSSNGYSNYQVVSMICKILKLNVESSIQYVNDRPYNDLRYSINYNKIKKLGWSQKKFIKNDLKQLVKFYTS
jgi:UDP-glucose 4,6-dehydratase